MAQNKDHWSSNAYQSAASFVPKLTQRVVELLDPQPTDRILDIGCGDGVLTTQLAERCAEIVGLDASAKMIAAARENATSAAATAAEGGEKEKGKITYTLRDCADLTTSPSLLPPSTASLDKAFSNAAMHWILAQTPPSSRPSFFSAVASSLTQGGIFVFEMGGRGNVAEVHAALVAGLVHVGGLDVAAARAASPWFFPGEEWMRDALEEAGFEIEVLETEYRPTTLTPVGEDGRGGLEGWVRLMGAELLEAVEEGKREAVIRFVCQLLEGVVGGEGEEGQVIGYVRLRGRARKRG